MYGLVLIHIPHDSVEVGSFLYREIADSQASEQNFKFPWSHGLVQG